MSDTRARVLEMLAESGIDDSEQLVSCLADLEVYLDDTPPEPSAELAALMAGVSPDVVTAPFGRRRSRMFLAGVIAIGAVGAGGTAAAANVLPEGAQTIVAELSERFLPFELPYPDGSREPHTLTEDAERLDPEELARRAEEAAAKDSATATNESAEPTLPAPTPSASATVEPSPSPSVSEEAPPPSAAPPAEAEDTAGAGGESTAAEPSGSPTAEEPSEPDPSAGGSTEPTASPSGSSDPSPTANTRTEVTDSPSASPSPSTAPSTSPSPSGTSTSSTSSSSTAVWSDKG